MDRCVRVRVGVCPGMKDGTECLTGGEAAYTGKRMEASLRLAVHRKPSYLKGSASVGIKS